MDIRLVIYFFLAFSSNPAVVRASLDAVNVREFNSLCKLFRMAEEGYQETEKNVVLRSFGHAGGDRAYLQIANFVEQTNESSVPPIKLETSHGTLQLQTAASMTMANAVARVVRGKAEPLEEELKHFRKEAESVAGKAILGFKKALAADKAEELNKLKQEPPGLVQGIESVQRGQACIGNGGTARAGKTLAVDLMCICAAGDGSHTKEVCGFDADTSSSYWQGSNTGQASQIREAWVKIEGQCAKNPLHLGFPTPHDILSAISQFDSLIGAQAGTTTSSGGKKAGWILGKPAASALTCTGFVSAATDICVNYADTSGANPKIEWRTKLLEAAQALTELDSMARQANRTRHRLQMLTDALEIELTRISLSEKTTLGQNLSGKENSPTSVRIANPGLKNEEPKVESNKSIFYGVANRLRLSAAIFVNI